MTIQLQEVRCPVCHRLLCKATVTSVVQIKCSSCKKMVLAKPTIEPVVQTGPLEVAMLMEGRKQWGMG